ncbi:MAG: hypothetical protein CAF43_008850 [Nitrospira sp. CG24C]|nr:MAG: hypothetical protein CAF43_008850 [Nitrospira sp. CG24C]TKB53107.1 MAG: hypothetical protein E8D50_07960 [Nitrospira sp.]
MVKNISGLYTSLLIGSLVLSAGAVGSDLWAEEKHAEQAVSESLKQALDQLIGKRVKLKLTSGQDLEGTVASVTGQTVQLTQLTGAEFFDAMVRLDHVSAVIVRARTK